MKMKSRILVLFLCLAMIASILLLASCDEGGDTPNTNLTPSEGLELTIGEDNSYYYVTGIGTCTDADIVIPSSYNGLPVTGIGFYAFSGCTSLTSVTIPDSITAISYNVFDGCTSLANIKVDKNNPDYKSIDGNLYSKDGSELIQYAIGKSDTSFVIPKSVTSIRDDAFRGCSSLASVTIPDSVTSIEYSAFSGCTSLASITIPDSVTSIDGGPLGGCTSLTNITVDESNPNYKSIDGNLYSKDGSKLIRYARGKSATSFAIPDGVTSIDFSAFQGCTGLTSVTIPDSVTSIDFAAFQGCTGLTSVTIPDSVTSIDFSAFMDCTGLTSVTFEGTVSEWNSIEKITYEHSTWYHNPITVVHCSDGDVAVEG